MSDNQHEIPDDDEGIVVDKVYDICTKTIDQCWRKLHKEPSSLKVEHSDKELSIDELKVLVQTTADAFYILNSIKNDAEGNNILFEIERYGDDDDDEDDEDDNGGLGIKEDEGRE